MLRLTNIKPKSIKDVSHIEHSRHVHATFNAIIIPHEVVAREQVNSFKTQFLTRFSDPEAENDDIMGAPRVLMEQSKLPIEYQSANLWGKCAFRLAYI